MRLPAAFALVIVVALPACTPRGQVSGAPQTSPANPSGSDLRFDQPLNDEFRARQALNRLTFGARPGDLAAIERVGVTTWINRQLDPDRIPDRAADSVLDQLEITHKTAFELYADRPQANELAALAPPRPGDTAAMRQAALDSPAMKQTGADGPNMQGAPMAQLAQLRDRAAQANARGTITARLGQQRTGVTRELNPSLFLRAALSDRQLLEIMTDFWENHFSVSADKTIGPFMLIDYDHAIRAHALGKFRDLLGVVAKSPVMLYYLDNSESSVDSLHPNLLEWQVEQRRAAHPPLGDTALIRTEKRRRTGINENYARELMELHTLGADGGYTQTDVQEVARCLTGWGFDNFQMGGTFAFTATQHDAGDKVVLGVHIPGGRGIEDGEQVLDILARHPSTAHYIARKLAVHFVSDDPPPALVDRAAKTYLRTDGDIREVLRTIITSPEFNSRATYRSKVKTPFELVASILRVMNAAPDTTQQIVQLVASLGQPMFGRLTPDGWPDQASAWMNTGALLNRVNLGARVASSQVPTISLAAWVPAKGIVSLSAGAQIDAVIGALLSGDASPETRAAMAAVASPPASRDHLAELVGIVIGSSDFQRR